MRRKQSIFNFNHIDPHIQEEELEEIKKTFPILSQKILVPETSAWSIQENESAHKFDLFRFDCNRNNCWSRDNESHRSGSDFRIGIDRENRDGNEESEKQN